MSNRGRSQICKLFLIFCTFSWLTPEKHTFSKELGWNHFSMKWEQVTESLVHETLFNTVVNGRNEINTHNYAGLENVKLESTKNLEINFFVHIFWFMP